jgi:hypothetical protein
MRASPARSSRPAPGSDGAGSSPRTSARRRVATAAGNRTDPRATGPGEATFRPRDLSRSARSNVGAIAPARHCAAPPQATPGPSPPPPSAPSPRAQSRCDPRPPGRCRGALNDNMYALRLPRPPLILDDVAVGAFVLGPYDCEVDVPKLDITPNHLSSLTSGGHRHSHGREGSSSGGRMAGNIAAPAYAAPSPRASVSMRIRISCAANRLP